MELIELKKLLTADPDKLQKTILAMKSEAYGDHLKEYEPKLHAIVKDTVKRPDRQVTTDKGTTTVFVSRLPVPFQKRIVSSRVATLFGKPITLRANVEKDSIEEGYVKLIQKVWDDNKLDYKSREIATHLFSETEVAEIWYPEPADPEYWDDTANKGKVSRLRMKILAPSKGDTLLPLYDKYGDMIAFCRGYKDIVETKEIQRMDIYTAEYTYYLVEENGKAKIDRAEANPFKKIPIIYFKQKAVEWADVQHLIDRYETLISNLADTNDYHGSPMVVVKGKITGWAQKGDQNKVLELEPGADASYLSWNHSPESVKLELETLDEAIHYHTGTPKYTPESLKGLGQTSGVALRTLLRTAHTFAADKEEIVGEGAQRRINLIKAALMWINTSLTDMKKLDVTPVFEYFMPDNDMERMQMIIEAMSGEKPIISQETATHLNPLIENGEKEFEKIQAEQKKADAAQEQFNNSAGGLNRAMNIRAV